MTKFKLITFDGQYWLAIECNGKIHLLYPKGKVDNLIHI